jgi:hypothetical protein
MGIIIHEYAFDKLYSIDADSIGIGLTEIWRYFPGAVLNLADKRVILEPSLFCERSLRQTCVLPQFFEVRSAFFPELFSVVVTFCLCRQVNTSNSITLKYYT